MTHTDAGRLETELSTICGHLLRRAQQVHNALWLQEVGSDPTSPQYAVLAAIAAFPGLGQRQVGELVSLDKSSTMDVVTRLERRGWLTRADDPADRRRDVLAVAPASVQALDALDARVRRVQTRLLAPLDEPQQGALVELLCRITGVSPGEQNTYSPLHIPGHLIRRAQQLHTALFAAEFDRELTGPQYAALHALERHPGVSQRVLGELAALDRSTTADLVQRLVRRGWVIQARDGADARRRVLSLTPSAQRTVDGFAPRVTAVQSQLLEPLGAVDGELFVTLLRPVAYATV